MFGLVYTVSGVSKLIEVKAQSHKNDTKDNYKFTDFIKFIRVRAAEECVDSKGFWKLLPFVNHPKQEEKEPEEEEECEAPPPPPPPPPPRDHSHTCSYQNSHSDSEGGFVCPHSITSCMASGAKFGFIQGVLTGTFFGGLIGMHKSMSKILDERKEENDDDETDKVEDESTTNTSIIFVCAFNAALACGVFFSLFSCAKSAIYCS